MRLLPFFRSVEWGETNGCLTLYLVCRQRVGATKFFYEMVSRWLLPGHRLDILSFFSVDFQFLQHPKEVFTLSEMVVALKGKESLSFIRAQLNVLEVEMRLGLTSIYHAHRILEMKGMAREEKVALMQEKISFLVKRYPEHFDYDIFSHLHHFLVMCHENFKMDRDDRQMARLVAVFYLFRRFICEQLALFPKQRFILVKASRIILNLPLGKKRVLGLWIGLNFVGENELFDERHLKEVLHRYFLNLKEVEGSLFSEHFKENRLQLLYLEVEKIEGGDFTALEIKELKEKLRLEIQKGIEKIAHPLFMPRNEEEVMRNIITLSHQLRSSRDLPQAILSFDTQIDTELSFTVIWARVIKSDDLSVESLFEKSPCLLRFSIDRVRQIGWIRKKFPKEASVFRVKIPIASFLRPDHSVDLFKARQFLVNELQAVLGEFRDYNGGMIAKQHEQYLALKKELVDLARQDEWLLELFFHSIFPIELRTVFPLKPLAILFRMMIPLMKEDQGEKPSWIKKREDGYVFCFRPYCSYEERDAFLLEVQKLDLFSSDVLFLDLGAYDALFIGIIYKGSDQVVNNFIK